MPVEGPAVDAEACASWGELWRFRAPLGLRGLRRIIAGEVLGAKGREVGRLRYFVDNVERLESGQWWWGRAGRCFVVIRLLFGTSVRSLGEVLELQRRLIAKLDRCVG